MENLKEGGKFASRKDFTSALHAYAVGSFGNRYKFKRTKDTAQLIEYKCKACTRWTGINVRARVHRERVETEKEGTTKKVVVGKGKEVTIIHWELCMCEIEEMRTGTLPTLPAVGKVFRTRKDFTEALNEFYTKNRKMNYTLKDNGNRITRCCPKESCPGMVEANLVRKIKEGGKKTWVPPLTITKSVACQDGCMETCGDISYICSLCMMPGPKIEMISGMCCGGAEGICYDCFMNYLQARPTHMCNWTGSDSLLNMVVKVGHGREDIWYRCPVGRCEWTHDQDFLYKGRRCFIRDKMPYGFCKDMPVPTRSAYESFKRRHARTVIQFPERNRAQTVRMSRDAIRLQLDIELGGVTDGTRRTRNERRMAIVSVNYPLLPRQEVQRYITGRGLWEQDTTPVIVD